MERGYREGVERGLAEANERVQQLERILDHLAQPLRDLDQSVADSLVDLSCQIARQVVRRELQVDRLLLEAGRDRPAWTRTACRVADRVLVVASAAPDATAPPKRPAQPTSTSRTRVGSSSVTHSISST